MHDPLKFQAMVLASALELYAKTGVKVNRAYAPTKMMKTAERLLGYKFPARAYQRAADKLREWSRS